MTRYGLTEAERHHFFEEGYVLVPDLFSAEDLRALRSELEEQVEQQLRLLFDEKLIGHTYPGGGLEQRLGRVYEDAPDAALLAIDRMGGRLGSGHDGPAVFRLITHPRLLAEPRRV